MEKTYHQHADLIAEEVLRRRTELGLTTQEVEDRGGPTRPTQNRFEKGRTSPELQMGTLAKYDQALEWPPGTAEALASGIRPARAVEASTWADLRPDLKKILKSITNVRRTAKDIPGLPLEFQAALNELTELQTDIQNRLLEDLLD